MLIRFDAPPAGVAADRTRRTITGLVVPWGAFARVSTGQTVAFARGSLSLSDRSKLVLDHDPAQPVAVFASSTDTAEGLQATWRVPAGDRGDRILSEAADGLRDGLSVAADVVTSDDRDEGTWVTAAKGRHVALLSEPAFDDARVSTVAAASPQSDQEPTVTVTEPVTVTATAEPVQAVAAPDPVTVTAAGVASVAARGAGPGRRPVPVRAAVGVGRPVVRA